MEKPPFTLGEDSSALMHRVTDAATCNRSPILSAMALCEFRGFFSALSCPQLSPRISGGFSDQTGGDDIRQKRSEDFLTGWHVRWRLLPESSSVKRTCLLYSVTGGGGDDDLAGGIHGAAAAAGCGISVVTVLFATVDDGDGGTYNATITCDSGRDIDGVDGTDNIVADNDRKDSDSYLITIQCKNPICESNQYHQLMGHKTPMKAVGSDATQNAPIILECDWYHCQHPAAGMQL
ncbi:hypothetical protein STEG23_019230, partial [Scotinomys teguina]